MFNQKINVGVIINSLENQPNWVVQCIDEMRALEFVNVNLFITKDFSVQKKRFKYKNVLYKIWSRVTARYADSVKQRRNISQGSADVIPISNILSIGSGFIDITENDYKKIKNYDLDIVIRFGFNLIGGKLLKIARHGTWSFHHGDDRRFRGRPSGFQEILHKMNYRSGMLQVLSKGIDNGHVLARWSIKANNYEYYKPLEKLRLAGAKMLAREIKKLYYNPGDFYSDSRTSESNGRLYTLPSNRTFLKFLISKNINFVKSIFFKLFIQQRWRVKLIALENPVNISDNNIVSAKALDIRYKLAADPFMLDADSNLIILECATSDVAKGKLKIYDFKKNIFLTDFEVSNEHVSFPLVFNDPSGDVFILPETKKSSKQLLLQWNREQGRLQQVKLHSLPIGLSDPSIIKKDGTYYLFGTLNGCEIHVWYSDRLLGEWKEHVMNPQRIDPFGGKSAGNFFECGGKIYRWSQNYRQFYGEGIVLEEITELNKSSVKLRQIRYICGRDVSADGVHHCSVHEGGVLIDTLTHEISIFRVFHKIKIFITRVFR